MTIQVVRFGPGDGRVAAFFEVPQRVYREQGYWMRIPSRWHRQEIVDGTHPVVMRGDLALFVARRDGEVVGRVCAHIDPLHLARYQPATGFFGWIDTVEDPAVSGALLDAACAWLRERGMRRVRGPVSLTMHEEVGLLVDGFDRPASVGMPFHLPYQATLVEAAGFTPAKDLLAWRYVLDEVPARARRAHETVAGHPSLRVRTVDPQNLERDIPTMLSVFDEARDDRWGWLRATRDDAAWLMRRVRPWFVSDLALVAEVDGEPAAVALALPDIYEAIREVRGGAGLFDAARLRARVALRGVRGSRLLMLALRPGFRVQRKWAGLAAVLYVELNRRGRARGFTECELGWTYDDDAEVNLAIRMMGGKPAKRYRLYERAL